MVKSVWQDSILKYSFFLLVFPAGIALSGKEELQGRTQEQPLSFWLLVWPKCTSSQDFQAFVEGAIESRIWGTDESVLAGTRLEGRGEKSVSVHTHEGV